MKNFRLDRDTMIPLFFAFSFGMILSNLLGQQRLERDEEEADYVMTYKGVDLRVEDLPEDQASALSALYQEKQSQRKVLLEQAAVALLINDHARFNGVSFEKAAEVLFDPGPVEENEIETYYKAHSSKLDRPYFEVRDSIRKLVRQHKILTLRQRHLDDLLVKGDLAIYP